MEGCTARASVTIPRGVCRPEARNEEVPGRIPVAAEAVANAPHSGSCRAFEASAKFDFRSFLASEGMV